MPRMMRRRGYMRRVPGTRRKVRIKAQMVKRPMRRRR